MGLFEIFFVVAILYLTRIYNRPFGAGAENQAQNKKNPGGRKPSVLLNNPICDRTKGRSERIRSAPPGRGWEQPQPLIDQSM